MIKKLTIFLLTIIFSTSLISCKNESVDKISLIPKGEEIITIKSADMLYELLSKDFSFNEDILKSYNLTKELFSIQNDTNNKLNNGYVHTLTKSDSLVISYGHSFMASYLNYDSLINLKNISQNKPSSDSRDLVLLYLAEIFYKNTNFNEYQLLLERASNKEYLNEFKREYLEFSNENEKELTKLNEASLFNIEFKDWSKKDIKKLNDYFKIYLNFYELNKRNSSLKIDMNTLSDELLNPNSPNYCNVDYMINKTAEILDKYKLDMEESPGFKDLIQGIITMYIPEEIQKKIDLKKNTEKIINGEFDLETFIKEKTESLIPLAIDAPIKIANGICNILNDSITNKRLALQFSMAYIFGDEIDYSSTIDLTSIISNNISDNNKIKLIDSIGEKFANESFKGGLNGNMANASQEQLQELFNLASSLKNY